MTATFAELRTSEVCKEVAGRLWKAESLHFITHRRGDADSASVFALALALREAGKRVSIAHDLPAHLNWLLPAMSFPVDADAQAVWVAYDTGNFARLALTPEKQDMIAEAIALHGREADVPAQVWQAICPIDLVIDHHASNTGYGALNFIDPDASSAAELSTCLLSTLESISGANLLTPAVCNYLYTGIVSDTQWFKRDTTVRTYHAAALLQSRCELPKTAIAELLDARSRGYFMLGKTLREKAQFDGDLVTSYIDQDAMRETGVTSEEASQLTEELERLPGRIYLLFIEMGPREIRVRIRGRNLSILPLARQFGGGGHEYRAGVIIRNREDVTAMCEAALQLLS